MSTIVAVEGFKLKGKHGVFDYEREKEQPFVVSIWALLKEPAKDDEIETGVDYAFLQRTVHDVIVRGEPVHMMETLCDKIIEIVSRPRQCCIGQNPNRETTSAHATQRWTCSG